MEETLDEKNWMTAPCTVDDLNVSGAVYLRRAEMELISKRIIKLQKLEMELATRYGMVEAEIDSAEGFDEVKYRPFSDGARCIEEAQQLHELHTLSQQCAMYPGGFEAVSPESCQCKYAGCRREERRYHGHRSISVASNDPVQNQSKVQHS
ncbi:hypothetical protein EDD85DRAFT_943111 [Armillaria nabsnona]|nr:hypothetical protein EDD85DRAFT_943111 [Armillaria nabsnona]